MVVVGRDVVRHTDLASLLIKHSPAFCVVNGLHKQTHVMLLYLTYNRLIFKCNIDAKIYSIGKII